MVDIKGFIHPVIVVVIVRSNSLIIFLAFLILILITCFLVVCMHEMSVCVG